MSVKNKVLYIDYSLLDIKEAHRFWVIHDRYATLNIIARNPKLTATGWTAKIYREDVGGDWTFELVAGAFFLCISYAWTWCLSGIETKRQNGCGTWT